MLLSTKSDEWGNAYKDVKYILRDYPLKLENLKEICDRPLYYAGYHVREIYCNLLVGNSTMESNHSSIAFYLETKGIWIICQQITKLMERPRYFINSDRTLFDDFFVR